MQQTLEIPNYTVRNTYYIICNIYCLDPNINQHTKRDPSVFKKINNLECCYEYNLTVSTLKTVVLFNKT